MATVRIRIEANGEVDTVIAGENRKGVDRGERVIWQFEGDTANRELQVRFHTFEPPGGSPSAPINPFSILASLGINQIGGTISPNAQDGLYIYAIHDGPTQLVWTTPLPQGNFGGIDIPRIPPQQPQGGNLSSQP